MAILELKNVSYTYDAEGAPALSGVNLAVEQGEFVCILGHNGSGKSTLAKLLNGLFTPTGGQVLVKGMDTAKEENLLSVRQTAGLVFQNPDNQLVATVVEDDVAFGPENLGIPQPELGRRVQEALAYVNMTEFAAKAPHNLSGGQKQRVAIAGVLAMHPDILVLDEATAMLDPSGRRDVLAVARKMNREKGITLINITHYMEETVEADRLVVLSNGQIALEGTPKEVFAREEELRALSLSVPEITQLGHALREAGLPLPGEILTTEEMTKALWPLISKT